MVTPLATSAHLGLTTSCDAFVPPAQKMILLTKAILPTIGDEIKAIQLRNCTNQLATAVADLKSCLAQTRQDASLATFQPDEMVAAISQLAQDLLDLANITDLKPLPGESLETCENQLASASKTVGLSMAQMLTAAAQANEALTSVAGKETLESLRAFAHSVRAIVACSGDNPAYQQRLADSARLVLQKSCGLVVESAGALQEPENAHQNQQRLAGIARSIAQALYDCVNCLPGQDEIDQVIKRLNDAASSLFNAETLQQPG